MCQSKSQGGLRCSYHITKDLTVHQEKYTDLVVNAGEETGIIRGREGYNESFVEKIANTDDHVMSLERSYYAAGLKTSKAKTEILEALKDDDHKKVALVIFRNHPETAKIQEREQQLYAEEDTKVKKCLGDPSQEIIVLERYYDLRQENRERYIEVRRETIVLTKSLLRDTANLRDNLQKVPHINELVNQERTAQNAYETRRELVISKLNRYGSIRDLPEYQKIEKSSECKESLEFKKWHERNKDLKDKLAMTPSYDKILQERIEKAGENTREGKGLIAYREDLHRRRDEFKLKNIQEATNKLVGSKN